MEYSDDIEYQHCVLNLLNMKTIRKNGDILTSYDDKSVIKILDYIYSKTCLEPLFIELYSLAAGTMISEDNTIGLAVLFSYEYFYLFQKCIISDSPREELINDISFSLLFKMLRK